MAVQWTTFEDLVLVQLILGLLARDKLEPQGLCREYNNIVDTVRPTSMGQYLGKKKKKEVTRKLSAFLTSQKVFATLMKEQIRIILVKVNSSCTRRKSEFTTELIDSLVFKPVLFIPWWQSERG